jgi:hypothetical protein
MIVQIVFVLIITISQPPLANIETDTCLYFYVAGVLQPRAAHQSKCM